MLECLLKFLTWFWSRPTLRVRISEDDVDAEVGGLKFEVENVSDKATSLCPTVKAHFLSIKQEPGTVVFDVRELDRGLPPFTPKQFSASAREVQPQRCFSWFRVYTFSPTKGRVCRVRVRHASLEPIGRFRFWAERMWFQMTGQVFGVKTSMTLEEYQRKQRSKGPH